MSNTPTQNQLTNYELKQIEELQHSIFTCFSDVSYHGSAVVAEVLYKEGWRKQSEGEWVNNHCSICGMMPMGDEIFKYLDMTPPRFDLFMDFCPNCGARMKGGAE